DVGYSRVGVRRIVALAASPHIAGLRSLNVNGSAMPRTGVAALAASPHLAGLRPPDPCAHELGRSGIADLPASANLPARGSADVSTNRLTAAGIAALARSQLAARLVELGIGEDRGGDAEAAAFAAGAWPALRRLSLLLLMTAAGISALAACPALSRVRELEMTWQRGQSGAALFASPHRGKLERLVLHTLAGAGSLEALAASPILAGLRGLVVERCDSGMDAVLAAPASAGLVELRYAGGAEGI